MDTPLRGWDTYNVSRAAFPDAAERGRLITAQAMANDSVGRKKMEDALGVDSCRKMYPEAYTAGTGKLLDRIRKITHWWS
jgi:hypothetical protein